MKYIGKFFKGIIVAVMMVVIIIGVCVIFGVKNVNITLVGYSFSEEESDDIIADYKEKILTECSGSLMVLVGENQVRELVDDNSYTLVSFEKFYPCTINITICERREAFSVLREGGTYEIYDDGGEYIRLAGNYDASLNNVDGLPNVLIEGVDEVSDIKTVASLAKVFNENFGGLRSVVKQITVDTNDLISDYVDKLTFELSSGFTFEIRRFESNAVDKIEAVISRYNALDYSERLSGGIFAYETERGEIVTELL